MTSTIDMGFDGGSAAPRAAMSPDMGVVIPGWLGWLAAFAAAFALYGFTASWFVGWQDSGEMVLRIVRGEIANPHGLAFTHPLQFWLGRAVVALSPRTPPLDLSLLSALAGAIAVANVFGIVRQVTGGAMAATLGAAGLVVAHTFWRLATYQKGVDPISAALMTAELWALVRWDAARKPRWLVLMCLANGAGFSNHDIALLTAPVLAIVLILAVRAGQAGWRTLLEAGLAWCAGASPFLGLIAQQAFVTGHVGQSIHSALFGNVRAAVVGSSLVMRYTVTSLAFTALSFPNLMLPAAVVGAARARRVGLGMLSHRAILAALFIHLAFVLRYGVIDQYTFLDPAYTMLAIFAGLGFRVAQTSWRRPARAAFLAGAVLSTLWTPAIYPLVAEVARRQHVLGAQARSKPYRDDYRYLFIPWGRGEDSAARMSSEAARLAGTNGVIIAEDEMGSFAIDYQLHELARPDVWVLPAVETTSILRAAAAGRPVVLVPLRTDQAPDPPPVGYWSQVGQIYVLARRTG